MTTDHPIRIDVDTSAFDAAMRDLSANADNFGKAFAGALRQAAVAGRDLDDVLRGLALRLASNALDRALAPLEQLLAGAASGLAQSAAGAFPTNAGAKSSSIVVNIATPDTAAFGKSQGQIAAMLARAVSRGSRAL
jgi:hypothetical protein